MTTENERITAATTVHTNCPQNPKLPNLLKYLEVFSNLFATYTILNCKFHFKYILHKQCPPIQNKLQT